MPALPRPSRLILLVALLAAASLAAACDEPSTGNSQPAPAPVLSDLTPPTLDLAAAPGLTAIGKLALTNAGTGALVGTARSGQGWLRSLDDTWRAGEGERIELAIAATCPAEPGTFAGAITIESNGGEPREVPVSLACAVAPPTLGSLVVTVAGLPAGVAAAVRVAGPDGWTQSVSATRSLLSLKPGSYTVTAEEVGEGSGRFVPEVHGSPATVTAGGVAIAAVVYEPRADAPVPGAGGRLFATGRRHDSVTLAWAPASDDATAPEKLEYRLYRSSGGSLATVEEVEKNGAPAGEWSAGATEATAAGLEPRTEYRLNVLVRDGEGKLAAYAAATVSTLADGAPSPGGFGALQVESAGADRLALSWQRASDAETDPAALEYRPFFAEGRVLDTLDAALAATPAGDWAADLAEAELAGLKEATSYGLNVVVRDGQGNLALYAGATARTLDVTAPAPGAAPRISALRATAAEASWDAATDAGAEIPELAYRAFLCGEAGRDTLEAAEACARELTYGWTPALTSARLESLTPGSDYWLRVFVRDPSGNVAAYPEAALATPELAAPVPGGDGAIALTFETSKRFLLTWAAGSDATFPADALRYRVYWSSSPKMTTPAEVLTNGTAAGDWMALEGEQGSAEIPAAVLDGQVPTWINVLVRNPNERLAAYVAVSEVLDDVVAPVPGGDGLLTLEPAAPRRVRWQKAQDARAAQASLEYAVYISASDSLGEWKEPLEGRREGAWRKDPEALAVDSLPLGVPSWINVFVRDPAGNVAAYEPIRYTPPAATRVVLYDAGLFSSSLNDATGFDARCGAMECANGRHAFIAFGQGWAMKDLPANYGVPTNVPIESTAGARIGDDWADLFDGSVDQSLAAAGVLPAGAYFWSGGDVAGAWLGHENTCATWTSPTIYFASRLGSADATDGSWISSPISDCSRPHNLLCLCY